MTGITSAWRLRAMVAIVLLALGALAGCQSVPQSGLSAAQIAALKNAGFNESAEGFEFGINDRLLFETNAFAIQPQAQRIVQRIARTLIDVGISRVRVYGYTDSTGSDTYNQRLSLQRASAVADTLASAGMARSDIEAIGAGKQNPVADNNSPEGRAENRRVAIVISTR